MTRRICFVLPHFHLEYSGGAETQVYFLAKELMARGWEVHYIRESNKAEMQIMEGIYVHAIPKRKSYTKWANLFSLRKKMKEIQADYWYSRANIAYLFWLVLLSAKVGGKVVWAFSRDSQFTHGGKVAARNNFLIRLFDHFSEYLFYRALPKTDLILTQTLYQNHLLRNHFGLQGTQIYNAHPVKPSLNGVVKRENIILWIGRLQAFKHPERFLEIAERLKDTDYQFYLIGDSKNDEIAKFIRAKADMLPNLRLTGRLLPEEIDELLKKSKLMVNTSDFEGFSNTFIEAWMRGVPVCSLFVDPDGLIEQEKLGVKISDPDLLAEGIHNLMENQEEWKILSENCRQFAVTHFEISQATNKLELALEKA